MDFWSMEFLKTGYRGCVPLMVDTFIVAFYAVVLILYGV